MGVESDIREKIDAAHDKGQRLVRAGEILDRNGYPEKAEEVYIKAIEVDPGLLAAFDVPNTPVRRGNASWEDVRDYARNKAANKNR